MGPILGAVGAFCVRFRWAVAGTWIVVVALLVGLTSALGPTTDNDISLPGTDSQAAADFLEENFPPQQNGTSPAVYRVSSGRLDDGGTNQSAVRSAYKALKADRVVYSVTNPFKNPEAGLVSDDGQYAFIPILLTVDSQGLTEGIAERLYRQASKEPADQGIETAMGGPIGSALSQPDTGTSEKLGMLAAAIILTWSFGSLIAMGMPLVSAIFGLGLGLVGIWVLGTFVATPSIGVTIARMIGLGVAIDYGLFLVTRHRDYVVRGGLDPKVAAGRAVATSGGAIVFAGGTVVIALVSLQVAGIPFLAALGFAAAVAVVGGVLAALTLLPAVLAIVGGGIARLRVPGLGRASHPVATRWAAMIARRPLVAALFAVGLVVPLALPVLSLTLGQADQAVAAPQTTARKAFDYMSAGFGPGYNGPLLIAVSIQPPAKPSTKYEDQYAEAEALQAQLEELQATLLAEQEALEDQQAILEAQAAQLEVEASELDAEKADLEAQAVQLRDSEATLRGEAADLERAARALARSTEALLAEGATLAPSLARTVLAIDVLERLLDGEQGPAIVKKLEKALAASQAREQELLDEIAATEQDLSPAGQAAVAAERKLTVRLVANLAEQRAIEVALARATDPQVISGLETLLKRAERREAAIREKMAENLEGLSSADQAILRQIRTLYQQVAEEILAQRLIERRLGHAQNPKVTAALKKALAAQQAEQQELIDQLDVVEAGLAQAAAQGRALEARAREVAEQEAALVREAEELAVEARRLVAQAAALAEEKAGLEQQKSDLEAQAEGLQAQAAAAQQEEAEANQLKAEITKELTAAGGDPRGTDPRVVKLQKALATPNDVDLVSPPNISSTGEALTFNVIADSRPASPRTAVLVAAERDEAIPLALSKGMQAYVGGSTASNVDLAALISAKMGLVILTVIALSSVLLLLAFRSLLIPVQAAVGNLLAAGAAFGIVTATFQWGWGLDAIDLPSPFGTVPVASYVPLMMFTALFGLSMDYQVFMMSTIQGEYAAGQTPREAVRSGLVKASKVIVTAALIMMSVFGSFIVNPDPTVKQFGVGLTAAVGLAAFLVLLFSPAMLLLFNSATWWLPRPLDRFLPDLDLEGRALEKSLAKADAAAATSRD